MFLSVLMVLGGSVLSVVGLQIATQRPRPASLAGALLAPAGLALALLGAAGLIRPGFWSH